MRNSPSGGGDTELLELVALGAGLGDHRVDLGDGSLERPELHHGVRDLTGPEGGEGLEESSGSLSGDDLLDSIGGTGGEGGEGGLHADLDGLHGDEGNIGDELGGGGSSEEDGILVLDGVLGSGEVGVELLEVCCCGERSAIVAIESEQVERRLQLRRRCFRSELMDPSSLHS